VGLRIVDPYTTYSYRVVMDGKTVAGVSTMSGLVVTSTAMRGRIPARPPASPKFAAVSLDSGITHDSAFEQWVKAGRAGARDIGVVAYDDGGRVVQSYTIHRSWASEYWAQPGLVGGVVMFQHVKLENEGWSVNTAYNK
jgi:phage tail-like protein